MTEREPCQHDTTQVRSTWAEGKDGYIACRVCGELLSSTQSTEQPAPLRKVTELEGGELAMGMGLADLFFPPECWNEDTAFNRPGRYRITVEFWPEEAKASDPPSIASGTPGKSDPAGAPPESKDDR